MLPHFWDSVFALIHFNFLFFALFKQDEAAVHYAVSNGSVDCLRWLLTVKRENVNRVDQHRWTPVDHITQRERGGVVLFCWFFFF